MIPRVIRPSDEATIVSREPPSPHRTNFGTKLRKPATSPPSDSNRKPLDYKQFCRAFSRGYELLGSPESLQSPLRIAEFETNFGTKFGPDQSRDLFQDGGRDVRHLRDQPPRAGHRTESVVLIKPASRLVDRINDHEPRCHGLGSRHHARERVS